MDTADILFIASDPREFSGAIRHWTGVRPIALSVHWAREGLRKGRRVLALANGAGAERARMALQAAGGGASFGVVCNIGFCGALDPALQIGDIVVAGRAPRTAWKFNPGTLFCSGHVVSTAREKSALRAKGATAVDMESAGLPGASYVKSVSDLADEGFDSDFNGAMLPDGRFSALKLFTGALRRPLIRFPELVRLQAHTRVAAEKLGDFLEHCDF